MTPSSKKSYGLTGHKHRGDSPRASAAVGSLVFGVAALVASAFSPHRLDAFGVSLLTLSVCLITPRVASAAVIGLTPEEEVAASKGAVTLGEKAATGLATAIWWVAAHDRVIRFLTAAGSVFVLGAAANAHSTADTARTELLLALGFGLFAAALFFGFISIVLDTAPARSTPERRLAVWLSSARPAIILGSVAFLVGTGLQLVATFGH